MRTVLLLSAVLFCPTAVAGEPAIKIELVSSGVPDGPQQIVVAGLNQAQLAQLAQPSQHERASGRVAVYVLDHLGQPSTTRLFGSWKIVQDRICFAPRYPLVPEVSYLVRVALGESAAGTPAAVVEGRFRVPPLPPRPPGHVTHVFPSTAVLPENALKFYLYFSVPMSQGEAYRRIRLLKQTGEQVEHPFLELGEELWDHRGMRFTLFFDPGRVKRGLKPREQYGPALEQGSSYTLVIDGDWPDDRGKQLARGFRKPFRVVAPDYGQPEPGKWQWDIPRAETTDPLVITFAEPLDQAMLQRVLVVWDTSSRAVEGEITVAKGETVWSFRPQRSWQAGNHSLTVDTALEDRAGNSIGRPFEVDVFRRVERQVTPQLVELPFTIN